MQDAFEQIRSALESYAKEKGVDLIPYLHEDPIWRLGFARRVGGEAAVDLVWDEASPEQFAVRCSWWIDDYQSTMRRSVQAEAGRFSLSRPALDLTALLDQALERVDGWDADDLEVTSGPYPQWHQYFGRDDFYQTQLPVR